MGNKQRVKAFCPECGTEYDGSDLEYCPGDGSRLRELQAASEDDPLIGEILDDRFHIESVLGEGGMGRVYVGEQMSVERPVAIKTLRPEVSSEEVVAKRFMRESQVISKFSHPNIVNLVDFGRDGQRGILYLVLELVDGVPLNELLGWGRVEPDLAVHILEQLCGGLAEAHAEGVIHRDLKPENMMLIPHSDGRVETKLLDFGIAHAVQQSNELTASGAIVGTPSYLAPEQAEDEQVGPYTDVYAVGIILFEMLTGRRPVSGDSNMKLLLQHIEGEIPSLDSWFAPGELPEELVELFETMTAVEPEDRPGSALKVRKQLRSIRGAADWDEIFIDPSIDDPERLFESWLKAPMDPPNQPPKPTREVTTGADQSVHQTDEHRPESGTPTKERGALGDSFGTADTMASPADSALESEAHADGGGDAPPGPGPESGEESADVDGDREGIERETFSGRPIGYLVVGLLGVVGVLGAGVYLLGPGAEDDDSRRGERSGASASGPASDADGGLRDAGREVGIESAASGEQGTSGAAHVDATDGRRRADIGSDPGATSTEQRTGKANPGSGGASKGSDGSETESPGTTSGSRSGRPEGVDESESEATPGTASADDESSDESPDSREEPDDEGTEESEQVSDSGTATETDEKDDPPADDESRDEKSGEQSGETGKSSGDGGEPQFYPAE